MGNAIFQTYGLKQNESRKNKLFFRLPWGYLSSYKKTTNSALVLSFLPFGKNDHQALLKTLDKT